jgi:hypothetical protein
MENAFEKQPCIFVVDDEEDIAKNVARKDGVSLASFCAKDKR